MDDDTLARMLGEGRAEVHAFEVRHPMFRQALDRLQVALKTAFTKEVDKPDTLAIWGLMRLVAEDFEHVLVLAMRGYGIGALKMLRPLYERTVTAVFLMQHPVEMKDFNDYGDGDARRLIYHALVSGVGTEESTKRDLEEAYKAIEPHLRLKRCPRCRRGSWTTIDLKAQADAVGLGKYYGGGAFWPTMLLHATRVGIDSKLEITDVGLLFTAEPARDLADGALKYAHHHLVFLLQECNKFFAWGLDMQSLLKDVADCWR